jgi:hypothetical protein
VRGDAIFQRTGGTTLSFQTPATDARIFASGASTNLLLNPSGGNVGIGTTGPKEVLHVFKSSVTAGDSQLLKLHQDASSGGGTYIGFTQTSSANAFSKALIGYQSTGGSYGANGDLIFAIDPDATDSVVTASDAKMVIRGSGNVGIGTTNPTATLDVVGTATINGLNIGYLKIPQTGSAKTASYSLVIGDVGKFVELGTGGTIVVPASVFDAGDVVSMVNNTSATIACTCSAITTVYKGGTNTNISSTGFSITTRGVATLFFVNGTTAVVTGNLA